jgi:hypothetical protein
MKKLLTLAVLTLSIFTLFSCTQKEEQKAPEYTSESYKTMIPETCKSFFDGCNNCFRTEDSENVGCTKMFCQKYEKPKCLDSGNNQEDEQTLYTSESWKTMIPETCKSFFDGCNNCSRAENIDEVACTLMYCEQYQEPKCLD